VRIPDEKKSTTHRAVFRQEISRIPGEKKCLSKHMSLLFAFVGK